jgi:hypothetical protein
MNTRDTAMYLKGYFEALKTLITQEEAIVLVRTKAFEITFLSSTHFEALLDLVFDN